MKYCNEMSVRFKALSENESFARICVAGFCASINPTIDEINDIKTAVSEAVTNCIVHAYPNSVGDVVIDVKLTEKDVYISITDFGIGIDDISKAKQPFYTSKPNDERSGMGFTVMEGFMDCLEVTSKPNKGVVVTMRKKVGECSVAIGG